MTKKILYILLGAILVFGILFLLWSWLFSGSTHTQTNGQFGTSTDATQNVGTGGQPTNGQAPLGQNTTNGINALSNNTTGQNTGAGSTGLGSGSVGSGTTGGGTVGSGGAQPAGTAAIFTTASPNVAGVQWINNGNGSSAQLNGFTPIGINGVSGGSIGGTVPSIGGTVSASGSGSGSSLDMLLATGLIGAASCALQASGNTIGSLIGGGGAAAVAGAPTGLPVQDIVTHTLLGAQTANTVGHNVVTFEGCITNVLAKAALQQITASVVNWINSGFNGSPSFVTNYQQFFTNVADLAAGQYIQGAGLSFLCTPFKLQIKIAIAQSYANRGAQSCTLTKVIKNVDNFMNGNFSQGGWPGMLTVTTVPTNNPYGAYAYAQIGLVNTQSAAVANAKNNITPTGFLSMTQQTCGINTTFTNNSNVAISGQNSQAAKVSCPSGCSCSVSTPGSVIEGSLQNVLQSPIQQLGLANDLDQIMNALTTQLMIKTLQGGLSNMSGTTGLQNSYQTPAQQAAQAQAQGILTNLQAQMTYAQQYGSILQGSISDIESAQNQLNNLSNCWISAAASPSLTSTQADTAKTNASTTQDTLNSLTPQITIFNDAITNINTEIATIGQLQSEALSISSAADVQILTNDYASAQNAQPFVGAADVTTAQQNRTTLQSQLSATNASTQSGLAQCQAFGK